MSVVAFGALVEFSDAPIEVLRIGKFVDSRGKSVAISESDLDDFVANFEAGAAGQDVPFDIDHAMGEAAGWLRGLRREGALLLATPEWNDLGRDLIGRKIYRYISATIDMAKKVIVSLSLVNFPAVKGLQPVALSATEHPLFGVSFANLFFFSSQESSMNENPNTPVQGDSSAPTPVAAQQPAAPAVTLSQDGPMTADLVRQAVAAEIAQLRDLYATEIQRLGEQRNAILAETLTSIRDEQDLIAFSNRVTSTGEHAIPLTPGELQAKLSSIPKPHRGTVMEILDSIHRSGTVTFAEVGTSAARRDKQTLSQGMSAMLKAHLAEGGTKEQFFADNADLVGKQEEYDLSSF